MFLYISSIRAIDFGHFDITLCLTIIPRARVGYEMAITISYPTSASGIIVLLKTPKRIAIFELPSCFR